MTEIAKPQDFKLTRFYVDNITESHAVQKAMFELGFRWGGSKSGTVREVKGWPTKGWIFVDQDCRMYHGSSANNTVNGQPTKAAFQSALYNAANAHHAKKVADRKAKRQAKAGWIPTNWKCPAGSGVVKFRGGVISKSGNFNRFIWNNARGDFIIVAYRPESSATPVTHVVPFADMIDDIVRGAQEMLPTIPEGFTRHIPTETSSNPVGDSVVDLFLRKGVISEQMMAKYCEWTLLPDWTEQEIIGYRVYGVEGNPVAPWTPTPVVPGVMVAASQDIIGEPSSNVVVQADTNPKKQFGDRSIPLNLWPALASSYGALGLYNGKLKYGQSNFVATPVEASIYIAGAMRHLNAWAEGEEFDPADNVPNLGGVLANIAIILEARAAGTLIDDRKLGNGYLKEREALKAIVASLQVLHADKAPRHYTLADA